MNFERASNSNVIASGRAQLASLQENMYLHNIKGNYEKIGGSFSSVDISIMNSIGSKIVQAQQLREQMIYQMLDINGIEELNEKYLKAGGNRELINETITDILDIAALQAFEGTTVYRNKTNENNLSTAVKNVLDDMIDEEYKDLEKVAKQLKEGLGEATAKMLLQANSKKKKPRNMDKYIDKLSNQIQARWRGEILEQETMAIVQQLVNQITGKKGNVSITGKIVNAYGKQIKSDVTMSFEENIDVGISAKNYKIDRNNGVEFSVHSSGSLENFYRLIEEMNGGSLRSQDFIGIKNIVASFKTPYFKYHLINQAAFQATRNHIEQSEVGNNIIRFIKMCLPLFIGAQMKIKGDEYDVDFFNISGTLVPVSIILSKVFNNEVGASTRIGLYSNYKVPWISMRENKMRFPVNNGEFYSDETQKVGGIYGQQLYKNIKVGTIHLKVALSSFK